MPNVLYLINTFPRILWKLLFKTELMRMTFNALSKHVWSKSILIRFHTIYFNIILPCSHGLLNGLFPSRFPIKNLFTITVTPMQAKFLTHFATVVWYPSIWQAVQIMKLHIIHPSPPISSVLNSNIILVTVLNQNQLIKGKKHSKAIKLITNHISYYITNYMFQHQCAIFTEFITNKRSDRRSST